MRLNKRFVFSVFLLVFIIGVVSAASPAPVNLGTAGNFAILSKAGISTTGTTSITGDIGVSPIDHTAITGFGLIGVPTTDTFLTSALVIGKIYAANLVPPTPTMMTTAVSDMETAYTDAAGRTLAPITELGAGDISGMTLAPGLYKWGTGVLITTNVVLDAQGDPNAVWIFQISQDLTLSSGAQITLINGAQAKNIFWQVGGGVGVEIGTTAHVEGNILALKAIHLRTGATLNGRALAQTAVTLDSNAVVKPISTLVTTIPVSNLQPSWTAPNGGGVYSVYYGPPTYDPVSPGVTILYDGREAAPLYAGVTIDPTDGIYEDQGLLAFKPGDVPIETFATQTLTYDFENQYGTNPAWIYMELNKGVAGDVMYQFVPSSNPSSWHTEDAATGTHWQAWTNLVDGITTGPMMSLADIATVNPGKVVSRVYLTEGMGDSYHATPQGTVAWIDKVTIGNTIYDFVLPDTAAPTISNVQINPLYQNLNSTLVTVYATITDSSGIANYPELRWRIIKNGVTYPTGSATYYLAPQMNPLGNGLYWTTLSIPAPEDNMEITYKIRAYDNQGNLVETNSQFQHLFTYDGSAPVTTDSANTAWTKNDVAVTLTCTDANCDKTYYSTDGSAPTTLYSVPFTLSATGQYQLKYYSTDKAGNTESVKTGTVVRIDTVTPVTSDNYAHNDTWVNSDQVITLTPSDAGGSGLASTKYCLDSGCNPSTGLTYSGPVTISTEGIKYFRYASADIAGNIEATHEKIVKIDKTLPITSHAALSNWYNLAPITVTLTPSNDGFSPVTTNYKVWLVGTTEPSSYVQGTSISISANGRYNLKYYSQDSAGNAETIIHTESNVTGLDTILPTVTINPVNSPTKLVTQAISGTFTETNIASIIINGVTTAALGNGVYSANVTLVEGSNTITVTATDVAGNIGTASSSIVLDTTAPLVTITSNASTDNIFLFQVTSTATDTGGSGVKNVYFNLSNSFGNASIYQQMSNGTGAGTYQSLVNLGGLTADSYTLTVNAVDNAGNIGTATPQTFVIANNVAPSNILPVGSTTVPITGGTVNFQFLVTVRGSNKVKFGMDNIGGFTPSAFNARISNSTTSVLVGDSNFNGAGILTLTDLDNSTANTQGSFVLSLDIPSGMVPGNYPINYYIDFA